MNRVTVVVISGLLLAGCGSLDSLPGLSSGAPTPITLNLESEPAGADVTLSTGGTCRTPCALPVATAGDVTATFTLAKYLPTTLTAKVIPAEKNFVGMQRAAAKFDPNPLHAELQPEPKPKRRPARKPSQTTKPAAPPAAAPAAAAATTPAPATTRPSSPGVAPASPWPTQQQAPQSAPWPTQPQAPQPAPQQ